MVRDINVKLELLYRVVVRDKHGRVKHDTGLILSKSWVIAMLKHLYGEFADSNVSITDTSNAAQTVTRPFGNSNPRFTVDAPDDTSAYGLVAGSGTTAPANTDYKLETQIAHGVGAGQLDYGAHNFVDPVVDSGYVVFSVSRSFFNGSGGNVTVNEIGIYCVSHIGAGVNPKYFCIARDVLATPEVVDNGNTMSLMYTLKTLV